MRCKRRGQPTPIRTRSYTPTKGARVPRVAGIEDPTTYLLTENEESQKKANSIPTKAHGSLRGPKFGSRPATISRIMALPTTLPTQPKPVRYVQYECCKATARSETRKLARVGPARCPAWGICLESGDRDHLARANGAIGGPYCSLTWPSACRRQCERLIDRGGDFGVCRHSRRGVLLQFEWLRKTRATQAKAVRRVAAGPGRDG
jgi:hypothetical protein